jgi:hypothetical protein
MRNFWKNHSIKGLEKYIVEAIDNRVRFAHYHQLPPAVQQKGINIPIPDLFAEGPEVMETTTKSKNVPRGKKNQILTNISMVRPDLPAILKEA